LGDGEPGVGCANAGKPTQQSVAIAMRERTKCMTVSPVGAGRNILMQAAGVDNRLR
jgi:hypothetical protein